jgi:hypothetical protein
VLQGASDQLGDVSIGQGIEDVFVVAASRHESRCPQHLEALGHRGHALPGQRSEIRDAAFSPVELCQKAQTRAVASRAEELRRTLQ